MSEHGRRVRARDRLSARVEPFWLNPATIKGTLAVLAGVTFMAFPEASVRLLRLVVGGALVASGMTDLWFRVRRSPHGQKARAALEAVITAAAGVVFLAYPIATVRVLIFVAAIYLGVRGAATVLQAVRRRGQGERGLDLGRGLLLIAVAVVAIVLPAGLVQSALIILAVGAVVVGAVMIAYGVQHHSDQEMVDIDAGSVASLIRDWMTELDIGEERRDEIQEGTYFEPPDRANKLTAWWVMLILSVAIAAFGVLQDSTAVVIGAMLIAPLMTPIVGIAGGAVNGWSQRVLSSATMVAAGVGAAIGVSYIIGAWAPAIVPLAQNTQVTSRVHPNIIDMAIAVAAGAAGAFASVNKRVSASIAGVAIAVALVPPLAVVGLTLNAGMYEDSLGAFVLFATNFVSIVLAAMFVFALTGYAPLGRIKDNIAEIRRVAITVSLAALVILIPLATTAATTLQNASRQNTALSESEAWLGDDANLRAARVTVSGSEVSLTVTGAGRLPPLEELEAALTEQFGEPTTVIVEHIPSRIVKFSQAEGTTEITAPEDG